MKTERTHFRGLFVTATDTGVGKTVVTGALAALLRARGIDACPFKPVATGARADDTGKLFSPDARFLGSISGVAATPAQICPVVYRLPAAPTVAARAENTTLDLAVVRRALSHLGRDHDLLLVEGIGGWLVPLAPGFLVRDLARELGFPVLVVARDGLGTINHTLLTLESIAHTGLTIAGVVLVQSRPAGDDASDSAREIASHTRTPVLGTLPYDPELCVERNRPGRIVDLFETNVDVQPVLSLWKD